MKNIRRLDVGIDILKGIRRIKIVVDIANKILTLLVGMSGVFLELCLKFVRIDRGIQIRFVVKIGVLFLQNISNNIAKT